MKIGEKIKLIRKSQKLSQEKFASIVGVSREYVLDIEKNSSKPNEAFINSLCLQFNVQKEWLLDENTGGDEAVVTDKTYLIRQLYQQLDENHKRFAESCLENLLKLQDKTL